MFRVPKSQLFSQSLLLLRSKENLIKSPLVIKELVTLVIGLVKEFRLSLRILNVNWISVSICLVIYSNK